jgi:hypothetical protein
VVHIPFNPIMRTLGNGVENELYEEITKVAKRYKVSLKKLSAKFELSPNLRAGHYLSAEVTFTK